MAATGLIVVASALAGIAPGALAATGPDPGSSDNHEITAAETRLFLTDHLANVTPPKQLKYRFERRGSLEAEANDEATLAVTMKEGRRTTEADFLHDGLRMELPPITDVAGNPILLHFLEREIRELSRLTGGSKNYYRKRIRMALAAAPPLADLAFDWQGKTLKGQQIRIDPYVDDPARNRYPTFASRYYTLILSKDIPGEIYQLRAELTEPGANGQAGKLIQSEVLTFEEVR